MESSSTVKRETKLEDGAVQQPIAVDIKIFDDGPVATQVTPKRRKYKVEEEEEPGSPVASTSESVISTKVEREEPDSGSQRRTRSSTAKQQQAQTPVKRESKAPIKVESSVTDAVQYPVYLEPKLRASDNKQFIRCSPGHKFHIMVTNNSDTEIYFDVWVSGERVQLSKSKNADPYYHILGPKKGNYCPKKKIIGDAVKGPFCFRPTTVAAEESSNTIDELSAAAEDLFCIKVRIFSTEYRGRATFEGDATEAPMKEEQDGSQTSSSDPVVTRRRELPTGANLEVTDQVSKHLGLTVAYIKPKDKETGGTNGNGRANNQPSDTSRKRRKDKDGEADNDYEDTEEDQHGSTKQKESKKPRVSNQSNTTRTNRVSTDIECDVYEEGQLVHTVCLYYKDLIGWRNAFAE